MVSEIKLSELPESIQNQIPYSLRTYKDLYSLNELPLVIQEMIEIYLINNHTVEYDIAYDVIPEVSAYGDFTVIQTKYDLVLEYFKNFLCIPPRGYPFDPLFHGNLKKYLQTLDKDIQYQFISVELNNLARVLSTDLDMNIQILGIDIQKTSTTGIEVEYNCIINLKINDIEKRLTVNVK